MRASVRPVLATVVAILAVAASASAAVHHHHCGTCQHHVRLVPLSGGGTSIHVGGRGALRAVVLSPETIRAAAVRDIDADGDLDIIASGGNGLVVWRNLGAGRYALAPSPSTGKLRHRFGPGLAASRTRGHASGLSEQRQQLAAAQPALTTRVAPAIPSATPRQTIVRAPAARPHAGRAPPARS